MRVKCPHCRTQCCDVPAPTWVPVFERLPDHTRDVVIATPHGLRVGFFGAGQWTDAPTTLLRDDVTHWLDGLEVVK